MGAAICGAPMRAGAVALLLLAVLAAPKASTQQVDGGESTSVWELGRAGEGAPCCTSYAPQSQHLALVPIILAASSCLRASAMFLFLICHPQPQP